MHALHNDLLHRIFGELGAADATRLSSCCSMCYKIGLDEHTWRMRAVSTWPPETIHLAPHTGYKTYRELVLDDNRTSVDWCIPLSNRASLYKYNRDHSYYECKLMHLEWARLSDTLRVYFDARGEPDLRHPMQSSLVATIPLPPGQTISSKHVLFSLHAKSAQLVEDTECHKKGCLTFDGCSTVGERIAAEVSAADQRTIERCGFELWFVYANQLPFSALQGRPPPTRFVWGSQFLDYEPTLLLQVPPLAPRHGLPTQPPIYCKGDAEPAMPLIAALSAHHQPVASGSTWNTLCNEQLSDHVARWSDLPENVARRGLWGV